MVTPKDELAQTLDFSRYSYLNPLLGLIPSPRTQEGIQELLRILTPTRDVEATREIRSRLVEWDATGAADATSIVAQPLAVDEFLVIEGFDLSTDDGTSRTGRLMLQDSAAGTFVGLRTGTCSLIGPLSLGRRVVTPAVTDATWEVRGQVDVISAGKKVTIRGWGWALPIGQYIVLP